MFSKSASGLYGSLRWSAGAVAMPLWWISSVWPSGAARATVAAATVAPAPRLFSTTTAWPSALPIGTASARATTSVGPPAANGTTSVIGNFHHWPAAEAAFGSLKAPPQSKP